MKTEQETKALVAWICVCGNHNAPSFSYCPECAAPVSQGQRIELDRSDSDPQVGVTVPIWWIRIEAALKNAQPTLRSIAVKVQPHWDRARPAFNRSWERTAPVRQRLGPSVVCVGQWFKADRRRGWRVFVALSTITIPVIVFLGVPNQWTALTVVQSAIRHRVPIDAAVYFPDNVQVAKIINLPGEPWMVQGKLVIETPGDGRREASYHSFAYWQGFPGQYSVNTEIGVLNPVASPTIGSSPSSVASPTVRATEPSSSGHPDGGSASTVPSTRGDLQSVGGVQEPPSHVSSSDLAGLPSPPATDPPEAPIPQGNRKPNRLGRLTSGSFEDFLSAHFPDAKFQLVSNGSGMSSYVVTRKNGSQVTVEFVRDYATPLGRDEWEVYTTEVEAEDE